MNDVGERNNTAEQTKWVKTTFNAFCHVFDPLSSSELGICKSYPKKNSAFGFRQSNNDIFMD